jgi:hypothetical protein
MASISYGRPVQQSANDESGKIYDEMVQKLVDGKSLSSRKNETSHSPYVADSILFCARNKKGIPPLLCYKGECLFLFSYFYLFFRILKDKLVQSGGTKSESVKSLAFTYHFLN